MNGEVTITLERYDELIRTETMWMLFKEGLNKNEMVERNEIPNTADKELENIISKTVEDSLRRKNIYFLKGQPVAIVKDNSFYIQLSKLECYLKNFPNSSTLLNRVTNNTVVKDGNRKSKSVRITFGNYNKVQRMTKIQLQTIKKLGLFDEIFKYEKVDRDQFYGSETP